MNGEVVKRVSSRGRSLAGSASASRSASPAASPGVIRISEPGKTFILPQTVQFGFHDSCSEQMRIAENGMRAEKKDPTLHYAHGVAYSSLPLKGTAEFEVTMTDYGTGWSGTLKLGVAKYKTGRSVLMNKIPRYSPEAADHCVWSSDKLHNRLHNRDGPQEAHYGEMDLDVLREGDRLGLRLSHDGVLTFFVNGQCQGVAAEKIYEKGHDVYVVVDHYANCKATVITRAGRSSTRAHNASFSCQQTHFTHLCMTVVIQNWHVIQTLARHSKLAGLSG